MDIQALFTNEVRTVLLLIAIGFSLLRLFADFVLLQQLSKARANIKTPNAGCFSFLGIVHIGLIVGILVLVLIYYQSTLA